LNGTLSFFTFFFSLTDSFVTSVGSSFVCTDAKTTQKETPQRTASMRAIRNIPILSDCTSCLIGFPLLDCHNPQQKLGSISPNIWSNQGILL
jgi:hypothetical protein